MHVCVCACECVPSCVCVCVLLSAASSAYMVAAWSKAAPVFQFHMAKTFGDRQQQRQQQHSVVEMSTYHVQRFTRLLAQGCSCRGGLVLGGLVGRLAGLETQKKKKKRQTTK